MNAYARLQRPDDPEKDPAAPSPIRATPFKWIDPKDIEPRKFVYGRHYTRKFLSTSVAHAGIGKSGLIMVESAAIATGRPLLGIEPAERTNVWLWNGEDPIEELQRRLVAIALHYEIEPEELERRVFLDSGRDNEIVITQQTRLGTVIAQPVVEAVIRTIKANNIGVLVIDPFVSSHSAPENDNGAIELVARAWAHIADTTNASIELVHHSKKTGGSEVGVEDSRGASALLAKARSGRALNGMTSDEAAKAGVENRLAYFRMGVGKANLTLASDKSEWFRFVSVQLGNGRADRVGDSVGVVTKWEWPDPMASVSAADLFAVQKRIANGQWRENAQSPDWVGRPVAEILGLDPDAKADKAKITGMIKTWLTSGALAKVEGLDAARRPKTFIEVGTWAS